MWPVFKFAARAAIWRTTPEPPFVGLPVLLGWTLALGVVRVALELVAAGAGPNFNPYGLNALVAWLAIELAIASFFVDAAARATALSAMFILSISADVATELIGIALALFTPDSAASGFWGGTAPTYGVYALAALWWIGGMVCVLRSLEPQPHLLAIGRAAGLWAALLVANALVPHAPIFVPRDFDSRNANWWEFLYAKAKANGGGPLTRGDVARIERLQPAMLKAEVARLAPQRKGITDVYVIGLAGWANEDVFVKELDGALASLAGVLPIKERTVRLVNHPKTLASVPLANPKNFAAAVHAVGTVMDKDEDVLVLLMTSHGEQTGFALQLPNTAPTELTPQQVASTLDAEGIKNRVVIVSACYSGIFLPPLANDNTIVMTASDDKNTSFGCAPERDWTYFGDALFKQSLQPGTDFEHAFDHARVLIRGWELMDNARPSNPQGHFGPALVEKLAPLLAAPPGVGQ